MSLWSGVMIDKILANPPFGVKNKIAKKVFDMFKEIPSVFLCQPQTFTKCMDGLEFGA